MLAALLVACGPAEPPSAAASRSLVPRAVWEEMVAAEKLVDALGPSLRALAHAFENLRVPDARSLPLFDVLVVASDLEEGALQDGSTRSTVITRDRVLATGGPEQAPRAPDRVDLLRPLLDQVKRFDWVEVGVKRGVFADEERRRFETDLALTGAAHLRDGRVASVEARLRLQWQRRGEGDPLDPAAWRIASWRTRSVALHRAPRPLFQEVLDRAVDPPTLARARHSEHERHVARYVTDPDGFDAPSPHFHVPSQDRHPGVAVTDIDGDGDDDLYVMPRWGRNLLLVNDGRGRFAERAADVGLDLADHSTAAIFADFDNDGDPDLFLGRSLVPSLYLENVDGRFAPRPDALGGAPLPSLVTSLSAVDHDGDGLLDLYVSTYAAHLVVSQYKNRRVRAQRRGMPAPDRLLEGFLPLADAKQLLSLSTAPGAHEFLALPGPPNLLLTNQGGGRFAHDPGTAPLRVFANTYQATWSDYDADGDPDVYLAHDFSPNQLFRNDGSGVFTDVTEATGTADIGFGMGVAWGDYDNDGAQDLYVTNMYSKAGNRITSFFDDIDPRFAQMAHGNTLFRNIEGRFERVSAEKDMQVEIAGWSWGGQFADLDNDGFLDLYALSGYYTAPPEIESVADI